MAEAREGRNRERKTFTTAKRVATASGSRKFGELMIVKEKPPQQDRHKSTKRYSKGNQVGPNKKYRNTEATSSSQNVTLTRHENSAMLPRKHSETVGELQSL